MDIGYVSKCKGKKGKLSNSSRAKLAMLKGLRKGKGKNPPLELSHQGER